MKINPNVNLAESFERLKESLLKSQVKFNDKVNNAEKIEDVGIAYARRTGWLIGAIQHHLDACTDYDLLTSENDLLTIEKQFTQDEKATTTTDVQQ